MAYVIHRYEAQLELESLTSVFPIPLYTVKEAQSCSALCSYGLFLICTLQPCVGSESSAHTCS